MKLTETYKIRLQELSGIILSEGTNQDLALSILKKSGHENSFTNLIEVDPSKNNKLLPYIAYFFITEMNNLDTLEKDFKDYNRFLELKKIESLQFRKGEIFLGNEKVNYLKFSEKVHSLINTTSNKKLKSGVNDAQPLDAKPIFSKKGVVDIYEGHSQQACIQYGQGYSFCISTPGGTMYQSYRDTQVSTFYFVFDRTRDKSDPLHIVVVDMTFDEILLTDAANNTGNISEYGNSTDGYMNYLSSLGVPIGIFKNKPKTEEETKEQNLLGDLNKSLKWFIDLSYDYKSKYIGRGHLLTDEQFDFLWELKVLPLLNQYVNIGQKLNDYQLDIIATNNNLLKSYLRQRMIVIKQTEDLSEKELMIIPDENRQEII